MPKTVFRTFNPHGFDAPGCRRIRVPFEIYTLAEAEERGIEPIGQPFWRERIFKQNEDLTGKYVLTDDDPPLVTPVVKCRFTKSKWNTQRSITFPWTFLISPRPVLLFNQKSTLSHSWSLKVRFKNAPAASLKLFFLLLAMGTDPNKIVEAIWAVKLEIEQKYLVRLIMKSERSVSAMSDIARDIFEGIGASSDAIAKELWNIARDKKISTKDRLAALMNIADRTGLDDREEKASSTIQLYGTGVAGEIGAPVEQGQLDASIEQELGRAALKKGGNEKVRALIESQGEEVLDE